MINHSSIVCILFLITMLIVVITRTRELAIKEKMENGIHEINSIIEELQDLYENEDKDGGE